MAEKQGHSPEIGVSGILAKATRPVLFRNPFTVDQVTEMIFAFLLVRVLLDEIFLIRKLQDDGKRDGVAER